MNKLNKFKSLLNARNILVVSLAVAIIFSFGLIQIGKAQIEKSQLGELTDFANSVGGNKEAFLVGLNYLTGGLAEDIGDVVLGAGSPFRLLSSYADTGYGYYVNGVEVIGASGELTTRATTTLAENIYAPVIVSLSLTATSSAENPREAGVYCNDNVPLLVYDWTTDISSNNNVFGGNWTVGTTTKTGDLSYTATSSATLMGSTHLNTSTEVIWNMHNAALAAGTYFDGSANSTSTPFVLDSGVCFIVTNDLSGATSTVTDFSGGFAGKLYLETRIR